ncbi:MAG: DUF3794 domain-containing protein [Ruthenibacterium sp.]
MEIKMYNDTVTAAVAVCDAKLELPIETEILVPDYLPQVFKIVKCFVHLVVLQKQMSAARLTLEGYLRLTVFYQSDGEDALCQTEQKLPFAKQLDIAQGDFFGADVAVGGETEYINCRAVNQRRIDVRGAYALSVTANAQGTDEVITALSDGGIEQKTEVLESLRTLGVQEKLMTAEESIVFESQPEAVLDIACAGKVQEIKLLSGKAVLKGTIDADVLYRAAGLQHLAKEVPFNEIIEVEGADEGCGSIAFVEPTGCTLLAGDDGKMTLTVTALLHIKVYRATEVVAVCEAFSTQYETQLTFNTIYTEKKVDAFDVQIEATAEGLIADEQTQILAAFAMPMQPELLQEGEKTSLRGRVLAHILCRNALGEIDCYDKVCEYILPGGYAFPREQLILTARAAVVQVSAKKTGGTASATVLLRVSGLVTLRCAHTVLQQVACGEPLQRTDGNIALRIYYAEQGEPLFDIARRYAVSPGAIAAVNNLAGDTVEQKTQLLVPSSLQ